jgi:hypothetical protein
MTTSYQKMKARQETCKHEGLFTVETRHSVREKGSQTIIAEARQRTCVSCGYTKGHVTGPWADKKVPFETKPGQNFEEAAREAFHH